MRFEVGSEYRRRDLHAAYGGQQQGGMSTPARFPLIFLITGQAGSAYGYDDGWEPEGVFRYFGEGQTGDMQWARGNTSLRDHAECGREVHLFEDVKRRMLRYVGEMALAGWDYREGVPDRDDAPRRAIVFFLAPAESPTLGDPTVPGDLGDTDGQTLADLRNRALPQDSKVAEPKDAVIKVRARSRALRVYVLCRADGNCEGCGSPAPFSTGDGRPFLEAHHTRRVSDGGPDDPAWVIGVCPNCHRRAHYAADAEDYNEQLKVKVQTAEAAALSETP